MSILLVEDEANISGPLKTGLEQEGFNIQLSETGEDAFVYLNENTYELIILDWMLPGRSGIDILRLLRSKKNWTPVIIITAKDELENKVEGLNSGADDYLVKPFAFPELLARVKSHLRRNSRNTVKTQFEVGDLNINLVARTASRSKTNIDLTNKEFDLLAYLCKHNGEIVTREMLSNDVWKITSRVTSMDSVIDVHVNRLRKKVDIDFDKKIIKTVRGVGFRLDA